MRADPTGRTKKAGRLRTRALWFCAFGCLIAIAMVARPELREVFAQSSSPPAASLQDLTSPAPDPSAQAHMVEAQARQEAHASPPPADPRQREIYDDSANLLKLANSLKAEVNKSTADQLSLAVVREAEEIEKLARKMRTR